MDINAIKHRANTTAGAREYEARVWAAEWTAVLYKAYILTMVAHTRVLAPKRRERTYTEHTPAMVHNNEAWTML